MERKNSTYCVNIEILRMVLMFMVVNLHVMGKGGILNNVQSFTYHYYAVWLLETLCYGAVDTFALISGYVLWKKNKGYARSILKYSFTFSLLIFLVYIVTNGGKYTIVELISDSLVFNTLSYWYFREYFVVLLVAPVLNSAIQTIEWKSLKRRKGSIMSTMT